MVDISYKNALKKTIIEIDAKYYRKISEKNGVTFSKELPFIPPLFDEFTIQIIHKGGNRKRYYNKLSVQQPDFQLLSAEDKQKRISHYLKMWNVDEDEIDTIYVKYLNATKLVAIYFEAYQHKKYMTIEVQYEYENGKNHYCIVYDDKSISSSVPKSEYKKLSNTIFLRILDISSYMQNIGNFVEYEKIEVGELKKSEPTKATNKPRHNKEKSGNQKVGSMKSSIITNKTKKAHHNGVPFLHFFEI